MSENRNQGGAEHGEQQRVLFKKLGAAVDSVCIALLEKRFGPFEMNEWRDNMREMFYLHDLRQFDRAFDLIFKTTEGADYLLECLRELSLDIGSQYYMPDVSHSSISRRSGRDRLEQDVTKERIHSVPSEAHGQTRTTPRAGRTTVRAREIQAELEDQKFNSFLTRVAQRQRGGTLTSSQPSYLGSS
ncbi:hypothetical protein JCM16303_000739 [Sporobolomyces ruberrimus]